MAKSRVQQNSWESSQKWLGLDEGAWVGEIIYKGQFKLLKIQPDLKSQSWSCKQKQYVTSGYNKSLEKIQRTEFLKMHVSACTVIQSRLRDFWVGTRLKLPPFGHINKRTRRSSGNDWQKGNIRSNTEKKAIVVIHK